MQREGGGPHNENYLLIFQYEGMFFFYFEENAILGECLNYFCKWLLALDCINFQDIKMFE